MSAFSCIHGSRYDFVEIDLRDPCFRRSSDRADRAHLKDLSATLDKIPLSVPICGNTALNETRLMEARLRFPLPYPKEELHSRFLHPWKVQSYNFQQVNCRGRPTFPSCFGT